MKNTSLVLATALLIAIPLTTRAAPPTGDLKQRLSDALGVTSWPVSVKAYGPVTLVTYNCQCRVGGFVFIDGQSRLVTMREALRILENQVENDPKLKPQHSQVLLSRDGEHFRGTEGIPGGGLRLIFTTLVSECEACEPFTALRIGFEFDAKGIYRRMVDFGYVPAKGAYGGLAPPQEE